jgi:hypothetical protein
MNHDEALAQLRAVREQVARIVQDVDAAIAHFEAFQPVAEAFQRRQAAAQAQWEDLMRAGGPDNLDAEAQVRHVTELHAAEMSLFNALRAYMATTQHSPEAAHVEGTQEGEAAAEASEPPHDAYHPS